MSNEKNDDYFLSISSKRIIYTKKMAKKLNIIDANALDLVF